MSNDRTKAIRAAIIDMVDAKIALFNMEITEAFFTGKGEIADVTFIEHKQAAIAKLNAAADALEAALDTSIDLDNLPPS